MPETETLKQEDYQDRTLTEGDASESSEETSKNEMSLLKHNDLITAYKNQATLLSRQLFSMSLPLVEDRSKIPANPEDPVYDRIGKHFTTGLVAVIPLESFEELGGGTGLDNLGRSIAALTRTGSMVSDYIMRFETGGAISCVAVVTAAAYDYRTRRVFIKLNEDCRERLVGFTSNYTPLRITTLMSFKRAETMTLYEYLYTLYRQDVWKKKRDEPGNKAIAEQEEYEYTMTILELRLLLGMDDISPKQIQGELAKANPDMQKIDETLDRIGKRKHLEWKNFRDLVLLPAVKEINSLKDVPINVTAHPVMENKNHKVTSVIFRVKKNADAASFNRTKVSLELSEYTEGNLTADDCERLLIFVHDEKEEIKEAYDTVRPILDKIDNLYGYLKTMLTRNPRRNRKAGDKETSGRMALKTHMDMMERNYTGEQIHDLEMRKLRQSFPDRYGEEPERKPREETSEEKAKRIERRKLGLTE